MLWGKSTKISEKLFIMLQTLEKLQHQEIHRLWLQEQQKFIGFCAKTKAFPSLNLTRQENFSRYIMYTIEIRKNLEECAFSRRNGNGLKNDEQSFLHYMKENSYFITASLFQQTRASNKIVTCNRINENNVPTFLKLPAHKNQTSITKEDNAYISKTIHPKSVSRKESKLKFENGNSYLFNVDDVSHLLNKTGWDKNEI